MTQENVELVERIRTFLDHGEASQTAGLDG
jgi:hypothetical protein